MAVRHKNPKSIIFEIRYYRITIKSGIRYLQDITRARFQILTEISIILSFYIGRCS